MAELRKICVHNSGGLANNPLAKTQHLSNESINAAHRLRWPGFTSKLNGSHVGYNLIIDVNGKRTQYRYIGEETAAAKGSNFDTVHILVKGNFTKGVEKPTQAQIDSLKETLQALIDHAPWRVGLQVLPGTELRLSLRDIYPHRILQPNHTECYGNALDDEWARNLILPTTAPPVVASEWETLLISWNRVLVLWKEIFGISPLGGDMYENCALDMRG